MNFQHIKLPELQFNLKDETTESGRKYVTPTGKKYPSVTTVLSDYGKKAFFEWRKRVGEEEANRVAAKASRRGTKLHSICESYLLNEMTDMKMKMLMPDMKEMFLGIKPFMDENITEVYGIEQALYSDRLQIAGRCDCIATWNGKISIVDWKTASREKDEDSIENYFMQASAYAEMFEERTGRPVDQIVIAISVEGFGPQIFIKEKQNYLQPLLQYVRKYHEKNPSNTTNDTIGSFLTE